MPGLTKAELRLLTEHASTDKTRPHLHGVLFDGKKGLVVATDGHTLAIRATEPFEGGEYIIPSAQLRQVAKMMGARDTAIVSKTATSILDKDGTERAKFPLQATDALFPPYHAVIPTGERHPCKIICMETGLLSRATSLLEAAACSAVGIRLGGELDPIELTAESLVASWLLLLMPRRFPASAYESTGSRVIEQVRGKKAA